MIKRSINNHQVKNVLSVRCFELESGGEGIRRMRTALSVYHSKRALGLLGANIDELTAEEVRPVVVATLDVDGTPVYSKLPASIESVLSGDHRDLAALLSVVDPSDAETTHFVILHLDGEPEDWKLDGDFYSERPGDTPAGERGFYAWSNLEAPYVDAFFADKKQAFAAF